MVRRAQTRDCKGLGISRIFPKSLVKSNCCMLHVAHGPVSECLNMRTLRNKEHLIMILHCQTTCNICYESAQGGFKIYCVFPPNLMNMTHLLLSSLPASLLAFSTILTHSSTTSPPTLQLLSTTPLSRQYSCALAHRCAQSSNRLFTGCAALAWLPALRYGFGSPPPAFVEYGLAATDCSGPLRRPGSL